jgi:hypothetical protein
MTEAEAVPRVPMKERHVPVPMGVRLAHRHVRAVLVLMMLVVNVSGWRTSEFERGRDVSQRLHLYWTDFSIRM